MFEAVFLNARQVLRVLTSNSVVNRSSSALALRVALPSVGVYAIRFFHLSVSTRVSFITFVFVALKCGCCAHNEHSLLLP